MLCTIVMLIIIADSLLTMFTCNVIWTLKTDVIFNRRSTTVNSEKIALAFRIFHVYWPSAPSSIFLNVTSLNRQIIVECNRVKIFVITLIAFML